MRDFIWVDDCVKIMVWLMKNPAASGLFNVGTGKARSFGDLAQAIFKALNQRPEIRYVDTPLPIRDKYQYFTEVFQGDADLTCFMVFVWTVDIKKF